MHYDEWFWKPADPHGAVAHARRQAAAAICRTGRRSGSAPPLATKDRVVVRENGVYTYFTDIATI